MNDLIWALINYEHNLDEAVGLTISPEGSLEEVIGDVTMTIDGVYIEIIPHHGCEGSLVIDYIHTYKK